MSSAEVEDGNDQLAWLKARRFLAEAGIMDPNQTPGAAVHTAYYAMHHAARAVLLRLRGDEAPTKHIAVVSTFGFVAKGAAEHAAELMDASHDLHSVYTARLRADYNLVVVMTPEMAVACVRKANSFVVVCAERFGFPRP